MKVSTSLPFPLSEDTEREVQDLTLWLPLSIVLRAGLAHSGLRLSGIDRKFPSKSFLVSPLRVTQNNGKVRTRISISAGGNKLLLESCPPDLLFFSLSLFKRRTTLNNTSLQSFTSFPPSNMWCIYEHIHTHTPHFWNIRFLSFLFWEGFIKISLTDTSQKWFSFFSGLDSKSCGHLRENCPTLSLSSKLFLFPLTLNVFLKVKWCLVMALVFKWPSYVLSAFHLFVNDHQLPFIYLNQCSASSCCLKHFRLGSFAEFSSWWNKDLAFCWYYCCVVMSLD